MYYPCTSPVPPRYEPATGLRPAVGAATPSGIKTGIILKILNDFYTSSSPFHLYYLKHIVIPL